LMYSKFHHVISVFGTNVDNKSLTFLLSFYYQYAKEGAFSNWQPLVF